jgi:hypothetical protein
MYGMLLHPVNGLWFERSKDKRKKDDTAKASSVYPH